MVQRTSQLCVRIPAGGTVSGTALPPNAEQTDKIVDEAEYVLLWGANGNQVIYITTSCDPTDFTYAHTPGTPGQITLPMGSIRVTCTVETLLIKKSSDVRHLEGGPVSESYDDYHRRLTSADFGTGTIGG